MLAAFALSLLAAPAAWAQPGFSKAFAPATIEAGQVSTLTFTIDNTANAIAATSLAFTDTLAP